ncbi:GGDEF domain-containing protein [Methylotenera sp.]|uniref:GGDEF domain-containing protein n=1 Tax=Methylotenera sp. TaxID=2051956 RepID=UPI00248A8BA3|nr:GGDEF domain-containing protein [Methylotenera sp.]MDI1298349.1 GGDEF domain-containing protein [Methylotenera sp.]
MYPVKNTKDHTVAIVAIEAMICDSQLHEVITSILKIYQNFTGLINDNERDTLTGLLNRKTFDYKINKILVQMQEEAKLKNDEANKAYFLAIFDIDHFKRVNDEFGHLIGDEVLLLFSQLMTQTFRSRDQIFRFGGEEFVGVFECSSHDDIPNVLNRFREKVGGFDFPQVGKVTVSAGYTQIFAYDLPSQLIDHSDLALYFAKNNGRNRVSFYEQLIADGALQENKKEGDIELF